MWCTILLSTSFAAENPSNGRCNDSGAEKGSHTQGRTWKGAAFSIIGAVAVWAGSIVEIAFGLSEEATILAPVAGLIDGSGLGVEITMDFDLDPAKRNGPCPAIADIGFVHDKRSNAFSFQAPA